jgi:hypothetical protein
LIPHGVLSCYLLFKSANIEVLLASSRTREINRPAMYLERRMLLVLRL